MLLHVILKIMVQFCYLRNYLGIETVSCRLLQWMLRTLSSKHLQNKRVKLSQDFRVHHQHGCRFIVLEHQYGRLDVM